MTSWWKKIANQLGAPTTGHRSHKKRAAAALSALDAEGSSWSERIARTVGTVQSKGSWDRRMVHPDAAGGAGSWARRLYNDLAYMVYTPAVIFDDADAGSLVAVIELSGLYTGTPVFALADDVGGQFAITTTGDTGYVTTTGAIAAGGYAPVVSVSGVDPAVANGEFDVTVIASGESGDVVDDGNFENPPAVETVTVGSEVIVRGKSRSGYTCKFVYPIGAPLASRKYTLNFTADLSALEQSGRKAAVGFGFIANKKFHLITLLGDGTVSGVNVAKAYGEPPNGWNQRAGFTVAPGAAPTNGTQYAADIQLETSSDGTTYTFRTSGDDQASWDDELTGVVPTPFGDTDDVLEFGIAMMLDADDAGTFELDATFSVASAVTAVTQPSYYRNLTTNDAGGQNYSQRFQIKLENGGSRIRVRFKGGAGWDVDNASVGIQDTTYNTVATPVELLFSTASGFSLGADEELTSDWADLVTTDGQTVIVAIDNAGTGGSPKKAGGTNARDQRWFKSATDSYNEAAPAGTWSSNTDLVGVVLVEVESTSDDVVKAWSFDLNANSSGFEDQSIRHLSQPAVASGTEVRVTFQASSTAGWDCDNASIGIQSSNYDTTATPVELLFSGASGFSIGVGELITSDWASLTVAQGDGLITVMDCAAANGNPASHNLGGQRWSKAATDSYNQASPGAGWTSAAHPTGVLYIEVR